MQSNLVKGQGGREEHEKGGEEMWLCRLTKEENVGQNFGTRLLVAFATCIESRESQHPVLHGEHAGLQSFTGIQGPEAFTQSW